MKTNAWDLDAMNMSKIKLQCSVKLSVFSKVNSVKWRVTIVLFNYFLLFNVLDLYSIENREMIIKFGQPCLNLVEIIKI